MFSQNNSAGMIANQAFRIQTPTTQPQLPVAALQASTAASNPQNISNPPLQYVLRAPYPNQFSPYAYVVSQSPYRMVTFTNQQSPFPLRQIMISPKPQASAPKPQEETEQAVSSSTSRPPDFIDTVQKMRNQLYDRAGIGESEEPPEGNVYSKWRKSVSQEWKPHNMTHYLMVAKLSNRCFSVVLEIPRRLGLKVTQSDFIDLYNKTEADQYKLLSDLLEARISFQELKRRRRGKDASAQKVTGNTKVLEDEISRLKSQNTDLKIKLEKAIEKCDKEKTRADYFQERIKILEKENEEALSSDAEEACNMPNSSPEPSEKESESSEDNIPLSQVLKKRKLQVRSETSSTHRVKRHMENKDTEEISESSNRSSPEGSGSESEEEGQRTATDMTRIQAKALKKKPVKSRSSTPKKVSQQSLSQSFQHEQDYDIKMLAVKAWVATSKATLLGK